MDALARSANSSDRLLRLQVHDAVGRDAFARFDSRPDYLLEELALHAYANSYASYAEADREV